MTKLSRRFIRTVIGAGVAAFICIAVFTAGFYVKEQQVRRSQVASELAKTMRSQTQALAATFLLPEQAGAREPLLESFKRAEGLEGARIYSPSTTLPESFRSCKPTGAYRSCIGADGTSISVVAPLSEAEDLGFFVKSRKILNDSDTDLFRYWIVAVVAIIFVVGGSVIQLMRISREVATSLARLQIWTADVVLSDVSPEEIPDFPVGEVALVAKDIKRVLDEGAKLKRQAVGAEIAKQVAHDVRSPLQALRLLVGAIRVHPDDLEAKKTIEKATKRITEIADDLLTRSWDGSETPKSRNRFPSVTDLFRATREIVDEKRLRIKGAAPIDISCYCPMNQEAYAKVSPIEFKRVISNLLENAIEAIDGEGRIAIELEVVGSEIHLFITDSGRGMPKEMIDRLGEKGFSTKVDRVSGLGVHHAVEVIRSASGAIHFESTPSKGTTVELRLPKTDRLNDAGEFLGRAEKIVLVDDDSAIHEAAHRLLASDGIQGVDIRHFLSFVDFEKWYSVGGATYDGIFWFDLHIPNEKRTGLEVVDKYSLADRTVVVSSRASEPDVIARAVEMRLRLLDKSKLSSITDSPEQKKDIEC